MNNPIKLYRSDDTAQQNLVLSGASEQKSEDRVDLNSLFSTLRRRRTLFLIVALGIFALGVLLTFRQTPLYTASATVVIESAKQDLTPTSEQVLREQSQTSSPIIDTEVQVIQSNELANKVIEALKLDQNRTFDPSLDKPSRRVVLLSKLTGAPMPVAQRSYDAQAQREYIINSLKKGLQVVRAGTTLALTINFSSDDPTFSAQIANEYSRQYTQQSILQKREAVQNAVTFLSTRIEELRSQAQADTAAVQNYRIKHNLLSTNASQLTEQEVSTYNQEVATARAAAAEDQARLSTARQQLHAGSNGEDVGEALGSGVVSSLKTQRAQQTAQLAELTTRYGPKHPDVIKAQNQLAAINASIRAETANVVSNLNAKTAISGRRLGSINGSLSGARGALQSSNRSLVGFDDLTRKAQASQGLYEAYLNRYQQAMAQEGTEQSNARIITWAQVPSSPSSPNVPLNLFLAVVLGIGAGLAAAFLSELAFRGMTTGEEVEARLGVPYLGSVPLIKSVMKWKGNPVDSVVARPQSAFAASFRSLQTSTNYAVDVVVQVVAVTSALPHEGKSTVAACLARVAALSGEAVVLVDCDPRRRSVNRLVTEAKAVGLFEVLRGEATIADALVRDEASGAWLLPLNTDRFEPGDYFAGDAMRRVIEELRGRFTTIVLDTAPVLPIPDSRVLATLADAVIFVARWRKTSDHSVRSGLRLLPRGHVNLAGVVLTQVNAKKQARFGYGDPTYYYSQYKEYFS